MSTINLIFNAIVQILSLSAIPFIWWLIFWRKKERFFNWIGFKKPIIENKQNYFTIFVVTIVLLCIPGFIIVPYFIDISLIATNQFYGHGANALIPAIIYSFLQTSLSEEIFFRGFLTKRLIGKLGFHIGNGIQSLLFGLMHGILFIASSSLVSALFIALFSGLAGWLMGWINEKEANGSIISSWILHGIVNLIASISVMFIIH